MNPRLHARQEIKSQWKYAAYLAIGYLILSCLWIEYSGSWAAQLAGGSAENLHAIERGKGFLYQFVTAILLYIFTRVISNKMAANANQLVRSEERGLEAERQAIPALLASSVAHDVANLLTVLRLNVEQLKRKDKTPEQIDSAICKLDRSTDRLTDLVERLRGASRGLLRDAPKAFDVAMTIQDTIDLMRSHASLKNADIEYAGAPKLMLCGYPILIHQVVMNLVLNAAEAGVAANGRVKIRFSAFEGEDGIDLITDDDGPGIPAHMRSRVLGAFFTTKSTGTRLGLMSVRSCVDIHRGTLDIQDSPLGGARFSICLPDMTSVCLNREHDEHHVGDRRNSKTDEGRRSFDLSR